MRRVAAIILLAGAAISGCRVVEKARMERVDPPVVTVTDARVVEQTAEGARIDFTLELSNPNAVALPLIASRYQVSASGSAVSLSHPPNRTLPAGGRQTLILSAALPGSLRGAEYNFSGSITYKPPGEIRQLLTESYVPLPSVGFTHQGTLP